MRYSTGTGEVASFPVNRASNAACHRRLDHGHVELMLHGVKDDGEIASQDETGQGDQEQAKDQQGDREESTEDGSRDDLAIAHGRNGWKVDLMSLWVLGPDLT